jgi:hypothetical protein
MLTIQQAIMLQYMLDKILTVSGFMISGYGKVRFKNGESLSEEAEARAMMATRSMLLNNLSQLINPWHISCLLGCIILLIASTMCCFANTLFAEENLCPETIAVRQEIISVPHTWEAFSQRLPYQLKSVSFSEGHPKEKVTLVNDGSELFNNTYEKSTWNFSKNKVGYWIECNYYQTNIALTKRLHEGISQCSVTFDSHITIGGLPLIRKITCQ